MMAIVVKGDALKPEEVEKAIQSIDGLDAVVSTIGGTTADPLADSQARALLGFFSLGCFLQLKFSDCGWFGGPPLAAPPLTRWRTRR